MKKLFDFFAALIVVLVVLVYATAPVTVFFVWNLKYAVLAYFIQQSISRLVRIFRDTNK